MDSILVSTAVVFSFLCFFMIHEIGGTHFSINEQLKLRKMLKNSAIKTITTEDGDIYDCVDVYKQPSLDHPLLQNHTVQLKPSFVLDGFNGSDHEDIYSHLELENGGCPDGFVPIRRIQKKDITRIQSYVKKYPTSIKPNSRINPGWHSVVALVTKQWIKYRGARGLLNPYSLSLTQEQRSDSIVYVSHGMFIEKNAINAGWSVFPAFYGDSQPRLYTQWTADNYRWTGCVDIACKGFVQVNKGLPLGFRLYPISIYEGPQFSLPITIVQDQTSGNWWLIASFNVVVGYWPKELFTGLVEFADEVGWGGRAYSPNFLTSPPIGSGHRAEEGFGKAAFVQQMQYTSDGEGQFGDLSPSQFLVQIDGPICYDLKLYLNTQKMTSMFFGGPGGNCGSLV